VGSVTGSFHTKPFDKESKVVVNSQNLNCSFLHTKPKHLGSSGAAKAYKQGKEKQLPQQVVQSVSRPNYQEHRTVFQTPHPQLCTVVFSTGS
jgi:hypothetical protein